MMKVLGFPQVEKEVLISVRKKFGMWFRADPSHVSFALSTCTLSLGERISNGVFAEGIYEKDLSLLCGIPYNS